MYFRMVTFPLPFARTTRGFFSSLKLGGAVGGKTHETVGASLRRGP